MQMAPPPTSTLQVRTASSPCMARIVTYCAHLSDADDLYVAFHPRMGRGESAGDLTSRGVRIIDDLGAHLDTEGVDYDVVIVSRPHNGEIFSDLLNAKLP